MPVSGYDTTADYGMGLVPIFYLWILCALFESAAMDGRSVILAFRDESTGTDAAMDGRFVILAIRDDRKSKAGALKDERFVIFAIRDDRKQCAARDGRS